MRISSSSIHTQCAAIILASSTPFFLIQLTELACRAARLQSFGFLLGLVDVDVQRHIVALTAISAHGLQQLRRCRCRARAARWPARSADGPSTCSMNRSAQHQAFVGAMRRPGSGNCMTVCPHSAAQAGIGQCLRDGVLEVVHVVRTGDARADHLGAASCVPSRTNSGETNSRSTGIM